MRGGEALLTRARQTEGEKTSALLEAVIAHPHGQALIGNLLAHSPFLSRLALRYPALLARACAEGPGKVLEETKVELAVSADAAIPSVMEALRTAKAKASLLIAIADLLGAWPLERVTEAMSEIAEACIVKALDLLLREAVRKAEIVPRLCEAGQPSWGIFVLAMGKLGARELNYSSDVDLMILFDRERVTYTGPENLERCFSRMAQDLVRLLQERTGQGYAFRVDLRLRPDPASTPAALSVAGALTYYETVGQNWERAALIKARAIAGDRAAADHFLAQMLPFLWRKHLDFASIADIQSIKRQMDVKSGGAIHLPGHNVKTGLGGIREIEFFVQIHQLIWGGRNPALRVRGTCEALLKLVEAEIVARGLADRLSAAYVFLRTVEHRLQMIDDQQTHTLPESEEGRARLASFLEYEDPRAFEEEMLATLRFVHQNFSGSFRGASALTSDHGKLSFTGVENDPQTLVTLSSMGYAAPASVSERIQGWHRGQRRATRTKQARELITELTPTLLAALAATSQPDQTFMRFDEFLTRLPAGVQLFSLFHANPQLLDLLALILGAAPAMAESLSKNPALLDTVLSSGFLGAPPDRETLSAELAHLLASVRDFEDEMDIVRRFKNERQFQAGVQLLRAQIAAAEANRYLSDIAETAISALLLCTEREFIRRHSEYPGGSLAVLALGRLGARELTFGSDIDLVFVYGDAGEDLAPLHVLHNKLAQRFITALTALTREGRLYEVDTRLRPSGKDGALAVSTGAFEKYFEQSAWVFEFMALTRARPIAGAAEVQERLEKIVTTQAGRRREAVALALEILSLREKVAQEFGDSDPWNVKYAQGGLMELDFLAQYFVLLNAHAIPELLGGSSGNVFCNMVRHRLLEEPTATELADAHEFLNAVFALVRLCGGGTLDEGSAPQGLKLLLARSLGCADFAHVRQALETRLKAVHGHFERLLGAARAS